MSTPTADDLANDPGEAELLERLPASTLEKVAMVKNVFGKAARVIEVKQPSVVAEFEEYRLNRCLDKTDLQLNFTLMDKATLKDTFIDYRAEVEGGSAPRTLSAAYLAGARAAIEITSSPFRCVICDERIKEIEREIEELLK